MLIVRLAFLFFCIHLFILPCPVYIGLFYLDLVQYCLAVDELLVSDHFVGLNAMDNNLLCSSGNGGFSWLFMRIFTSFCKDNKH